MQHQIVEQVPGAPSSEHTAIQQCAACSDHSAATYCVFSASTWHSPTWPAGLILLLPHLFISHRFAVQVKRNLHMVLSFSPVGGEFRERLRKFPSLVNCTTIDWFSEWPRDALHTVATQFLADLPGVDAKVSQSFAILHSVLPCTCLSPGFIQAILVQSLPSPT